MAERLEIEATGQAHIVPDPPDPFTRNPVAIRYERIDVAAGELTAHGVTLGPGESLEVVEGVPVLEPCRDRTPCGWDEEAECELRTGHLDEWHQETRWYTRYTEGDDPNTDHGRRASEVVIRWRAGFTCRVCGTHGRTEECEGDARAGCLERRARQDAVNRGDLWP